MTAITPILAERQGFGELIIWLIMGVIWLIGVISEQIKKRNLPKAAPRPTPPAPAPTEPESRPEDPAEADEPADLEDLERRFRRMLGAPETDEEDEAPAPRPTPARAAMDAPLQAPPAGRVIQFDLPHRAEPAIRFDFAHRAETGGPPASAPEEADAFAQVADMVDIEQVMRDSHPQGASVINPNQFLVNLSKLKMPLLRTPVMTQTSVRSVVVPPDVKRPSVLRATMIGSIVLGPPKGL